jgi:hypothetical protein
MRHVFDPLTCVALGRLGLDDHNGTRALEVKGHISGIWRGALCGVGRMVKAGGLVEHRPSGVALLEGAFLVRPVRGRAGAGVARDSLTPLP